MRLLFVLGSLGIGGAERHTLDLAKRLKQRGHECRILSVKARDVAQHRFGEDGEVDIRYCNGRRYFDFSAIGNFADELHNFRPDLIVAVNQYALLYAHLARWRADMGPTPIAIVFHTTQIVSRRERLLNYLYHRFFSVTDLLIFVCQFQANYWKLRGLHAKQSHVIPNGVDLRVFAPRTADLHAIARRRLGVTDDELVMGITAGLRPEKNHVFLLQAMKTLRERGVPWKLAIVGDGPLRENLVSMASSIGLGDRVLFLGAHQDVRSVVAAFDAFVLVSTIETFSLAALEAMSMGVPAILSDVGGAREMVSDGDNGYVFPSGDEPAFVQCIENLTDVDRRLKMGSRAADIVRESFDIHKMVSKYENVFEALLLR